jgi:hypothetical protein
LHFAMLRTLAAKDPHLCVNFLYGGDTGVAKSLMISASP